MRRIGIVLLLTFSLGAVFEPFRRKLEAKIDAADAAFDGVLGVAVLDLETGDAIARNGAEVFPTASTIKIGVLTEYLRQVEAGAIDPSAVYALDARDIAGGSGILSGMKPGTKRTLGELAALMIVESDNTATNVLIDRLGLDRINRQFEALDLTQTRLRRRMMDAAAAREGRENTATPAELVRLLEAIYRGEVCGAACTKEILRVLSLPKTSAIRRAVPAEVRVANKAGDLEGVRVDAGIVFSGKRPFAIAVMTTLAADEKAAEATIETIARAAHSYFDRLGRASRYGRLNE